MTPYHIICWLYTDPCNYHIDDPQNKVVQSGYFHWKFEIFRLISTGFQDFFKTRQSESQFFKIPTQEHNYRPKPSPDRLHQDIPRLHSPQRNFLPKLSAKDGKNQKNRFFHRNYPSISVAHVSVTVTRVSLFIGAVPVNLLALQNPSIWDHKIQQKIPE